jgi:hypothetical protein
MKILVLQKKIVKQRWIGEFFALITFASQKNDAGVIKK